MQIDLKKMEAALENPKDRAGRKYLSGLTETFRREEPEKSAQIMKKAYPEGPCRESAKRCRRARTLCVLALIAAGLVVIAAYFLSDFGASVLTGWVNRYLLSAGIVFAMGILVLAGLYNGRSRDLLLAAVLLEEAKETAV